MIFALPVFALLMRIKGGGPDIAPKWFRDLDGSIVSAIGFGALCACHYPLWQAVLCGAGWVVGNSPSIGEEIGAIGGIKGNWFSDRESWAGGKFFNWIKSDRLWGWFSGALRGTFLGVCLALPTLSTRFILLGALFPLVYFIGVSARQIIMGRREPKGAWVYAEYLYGAVLGVPFLI